MKKVIIIILFSCSVQVSNSQTGFNNWITVGGNSNRDGFISGYFDFINGFSRTFNAPSTLWGMPIFTYENKFVTSRYSSLNPLRASVVAFNFNNINPVWNYGQTSGVNIVMGFNDNKVYVRDFQQNGFDTISALNANDGSVIWKSRFTVERGIIWTAVFTINGDLIVPGSGTKRIMRINSLNGDTVWTNSRIIPNTGAESMCLNGNTLYAWEGGITTPKKIIAIDINTGIKKYSSVDLPGDGDQEIPFTVSTSGIIYCIRDGGLMYSIKDSGTGLDIIWSRNVIHPVGTYSQIAIAIDSNVYIPFGKKILRLNYHNGAAMDSSVDLVNTGTINPRFATGKFGRILVGNGADQPSEGKYFALTQTLQNQKEIPVPYNYYCGPAIGSNILNPYFLICGAGTEIKSEYIIIDGIESNTSTISDEFILEQNYPNPFNPVTSINYELKRDSYVLLEIFDIKGNRLQTLVKEKQNPGKYKISFEGENLSNGIYFYKLTSDDGIKNYSQTRKMILTK